MAYEAVSDAIAERFARRDRHVVYVNRVIKGSAAEKAGIRASDIILSADNVPIAFSTNGSAVNLVEYVLIIPVGKEVAFKVWRDGRAVPVVVTLRARDE